MPSGPDPSSLTSQLLLLVFLILINAFFAMSEMALVSVNKNRIKILAQDGNKKADLLLRLLEDQNKFLSTIQVAITLAGFLSSASASVSMADDLGGFMSKYGVPYAEPIAVVIITMILSYFTLVLGELYPKRIALQHSEKIALLVVKPINVVSKFTKPFVWLLSKSVNVLLIITRQKVVVEDDEFSEDEIISMLEAGQESGALKEEGKKMINAIFDFDDKLAYEIMTPRTDVFTIDVNDPPSEYLDELMELRYSRIPVYDDDLDNIIGILHIKDYLKVARTNEHNYEEVDIRSLLRKPYFVPETKNIDSLLYDLQRTKTSIAILIDEYGGFSGIVTTEDIIEEIVGDIEDEYDEEEAEIEKIDENTYIVSGFVYLDDLEEEIGVELESENSETIGGFLIDILGEIPDEDEAEQRIIEHENYVFKILSVKERRIEKVEVFILPEIEDEETEDEDE
ncbi:MAG: HlyC/CorC family transporter [Clostridiales bacterium]|nr:HlyC/CorC family transporter [Clostridiales bacterium]